jgi:hypothetical protein
MADAAARIIFPIAIALAMPASALERLTVSLGWQTAESIFESGRGLQESISCDWPPRNFPDFFLATSP